MSTIASHRGMTSYLARSLDAEQAHDATEIVQILVGDTT